ncbi:MAG: PilZ domain-containing protein [Acidobacteria bacterium]|nr:PilZ domain-containing protein [Acidobacteriota bacterium]
MMITAAASSRTVLIASAATGVRDRFVEALRQAGHRPLEAAQTSDLLGSVDTHRPAVDLLLLDLGLADGDGVSLVRRVRDHAGTLPIIVLSGSITSADEVRGLAALGVTGYVNEHLDAQQILPALAPHLFPDRFDRRSSRRVVLAIPVSYRFDTTIASALTLNLGKGGLAIRTMSTLAVSTEVHARFRLPGSDREIGADSRVVWSDRQVGMGLQFEQVDAGDQTAVDDYVDRHDQSDLDASRPE